MRHSHLETESPDQRPIANSLGLLHMAAEATHISGPKQRCQHEGETDLHPRSDAVCGHRSRSLGNHHPGYLPECLAIQQCPRLCDIRARSRPLGPVLGRLHGYHGRHFAGCLPAVENSVRQATTEVQHYPRRTMVRSTRNVKRN